MDQRQASVRKDLEGQIDSNKYQVELMQQEVERLRHAKQDFDRERDQHLADIQNAEEENERQFEENKDLKRKVKKLELILYGKK